jgi:hypothetical protein
MLIISIMGVPAVALLFVLAVDTEAFGLIGVFDLVGLMIRHSGQFRGVAESFVSLGVGLPGVLRRGNLSLKNRTDDVWRNAAHIIPKKACDAHLTGTSTRRFRVGTTWPTFLNPPPIFNGGVIRGIG